MKAVSAWLMSLWLGMQLGFTLVVSPILFTSVGINKASASSVMNGLFDIANGVGILACFGAYGIVSRPMQWGNRQFAKKMVVVVLMGLMLSILLLNRAVANYPQHFLFYFLGGDLGLWRGGLHVWNLVLGLMAMIMCVRFLRVDNA